LIYLSHLRREGRRGEGSERRRKRGKGRGKGRDFDLQSKNSSRTPEQTVPTQQKCPQRALRQAPLSLNNASD